ncbi:MAG: type III secretion system export apparatus subunit SctR [Chlamydiales bacterium]
MTKLFSLKMGLIALGLLAMLWMVPDRFIYAQSNSAKQLQSEPIAPPTSSIIRDRMISAASESKTLPPKTPLPPKSNPTTSKTKNAQPASQPPPTEIKNAQRPNLVTQTILLALMSLLPFIIMILTSFLKVVIVLSLLRTALGVQNAPPNQVLNGVAFLLSLFIMYPTGAKMYDATKVVSEQAQAPDSLMSPDSSTYVIAMSRAAAEPLREFLIKNASPKHHAIFYRLAYRGLPEEYRESLKPTDFIVVIPAYITGQLKDAFEIGVLIYIPFFVIDLVTSNILLAMGMMMLSPVTISMPLKLFLLVMLDGWTLLIEGLVKTFQ